LEQLLGHAGNACLAVKIAVGHLIKRLSSVDIQHRRGNLDLQLRRNPTYGSFRCRSLTFGRAVLSERFNFLQSFTPREGIFLSITKKLTLIAKILNSHIPINPIGGHIARSLGIAVNTLQALHIIEEISIAPGKISARDVLEMRCGAPCP
jgi:hypothetical protein